MKRKFALIFIVLSVCLLNIMVLCSCAKNFNSESSKSVNGIIVECEVEEYYYDEWADVSELLINVKIYNPNKEQTVKSCEFKLFFYDNDGKELLTKTYECSTQILPNGIVNQVVDLMPTQRGDILFPNIILNGNCIVGKVERVEVIATKMILTN